MYLMFIVVVKKGKQSNWFLIIEILLGIAAIGFVTDAVVLVTEEMSNRCVDEEPNCIERGINGDCDIDPAFMLVRCPVTCNSCLPKGIFLCQ